MAQTQTQTQQTGEVEATNERGIKLGGRWLNYSQFRLVPHPEAGHVVRVTLQRDRFITDLEVLDGASLDDAEGAADPGEVDGDFPEFEGPPPPVASDIAPGPDGPHGGDYPRRSAAPGRTSLRGAPTPQPTRSRESVKATCALAAATWAQGRADVDAQDVIAIAEMLAAWCRQPEED
jgi:hypothetical protein